MKPIWIMFSIAIIFLIIYFAVDNYLTKKRLEINQRDWDEYSKNMTRQEKLMNFKIFLNEQKRKYNWRYYYIPDIKLKESLNADND